jgi:hypothetical protein
VWLSGSWGEARVLRDIEVVGEAVARVGAGEIRPDGVHNSSTQVVPFPFEWEGGWWWRVESERVEVEVPLACDTRLAIITLQFHGVSLTGRGLDHPETFEIGLA